MLEKNSIVEVEITDLSHEGAGVASDVSLKQEFMSEIKEEDFFM